MDQRSRAANFALIAALIGGATYLAADYLHLTQAVSLAWKATGVGFLALYAALSARSTDGWLLAAVMTFGVAGDVLLGAVGVVGGGLAFLLGHLIAIALYLRNRRTPLRAADALVAAVMIAATVTLAYLLPADRAAAPGVAIYATGLAAMAAAAWVSRFPRDWVGLGARLFVVSDLLIFARAGPLAGQAWVGAPIWSLYFAGQALICVGVVRTLNARLPSLKGKG